MSLKTRAVVGQLILAIGALGAGFQIAFGWFAVLVPPTPAIAQFVIDVPSAVYWLFVTAGLMILFLPFVSESGKRESLLIPSWGRSQEDSTAEES